MIHHLSSWRSERRERTSKASYKEWNPLHLEELFSLLKSVEEGEGSVVTGISGVTISTGYGLQATLLENGTVRLGDREYSVTERLHFKKTNCFTLLNRSTLLRFLGLVLASIADGMGFVEWSAGHGVIYSDVYGCWVVISRDGSVEFNKVFRLEQHG